MLSLFLIESKELVRKQNKPRWARHAAGETRQVDPDKREKPVTAAQSEPIGSEQIKHEQESRPGSDLLLLQ